MQPGSRGKLVRDRIPEIIRATGGNPSTEVLSPDAYTSSLDEKLREEVQEFLDADVTHRLEELADVLEVMHALAQNHGFGWEAVEEFRREKAERRGGFGGRLFLLDDLTEASGTEVE